MKKQLLGIVGASVLFASVLAPSAFADNPYGIQYTGGQELSNSNVQIKTDLTPLIKYGGAKQITASNSSLWQKGYQKTSNSCREIIYIKVPGNDQINDNNLFFTISNDQYTVKVNIEKVILDGVTDVNANNALVISVPPHGSIEVNDGSTIYSSRDAAGQCENLVSGIKQHFYRSDPGFVFVQTKINLFDRAQEKVSSSNLYFGITDLDFAQSAKITSSDSLLQSGNMFVESFDVLQPTDSTLRNMFVSDGNYVYSQYGTGAGEYIATDEITNIFAKVGATSQEEGLGVVFGYKSSAGSGVEYFAKQHLVKYISDENGIITGITEEDIIAGNTPDGSASQPNDGYEFTNWTVDKDVALIDGTTIKAGATITAAQIKQVVVNEELIFTAHHEASVDEETDIIVPDTGAFTGEANAALISASVFGVLTGALIIGLLHRMNHKKINFTK